MIPLSINWALWPDFSVWQILKTDYLPIEMNCITFREKHSWCLQCSYSIIPHKKSLNKLTVCRTLSVAACSLIILNQMSITLWKYCSSNLPEKKIWWNFMMILWRFPEIFMIYKNERDYLSQILLFC